MRRIVVAGIHTEVGKTVAATAIASSLQGDYWKPIECGPDKDSVWVRERLASPGCVFPPAHSFQEPVSPHLAARLEGVDLTAKALVPPVTDRFLIIEGTGGILAPLNATESWADAAALWQAEWILVHRHYLGSLNHFALTVEAMRARKLSLLGVIFNGAGDAETETMLLRKGNTCCLGRLLWHNTLTPAVIWEIAALWRSNLLAALGFPGILPASGILSPRHSLRPPQSPS